MFTDRIRSMNNQTPAQNTTAGFVALPNMFLQQAGGGVATIYALAREQAEKSRSGRRKSIFERDLFCCWN